MGSFTQALMAESSASACVLLTTTMASTTTEPGCTLVIKTWDGSTPKLAASHDCMSAMKACMYVALFSKL